MKIGEGGQVAPGEITARLRDARADAFDKICERFKMSPSLLAKQPAHELMSMVKEVLGPSAFVDPAMIRDQATEYAQSK